MTTPRLTFQNKKLVLIDGKAGTGQECCCSCQCSSGNVLAGKTISCTATLILPDVPGDCPAGTYDATFPLEWDGVLGNYSGCLTVDFGGGIFGRAGAILTCDSETYGPPPRWASVCFFNTDGDCDLANGFCLIGGFLGFSNPFAGAYIHTSRTVEGVCIPGANTFTRNDMDLDVSLTYTISVT